MENFANLLEIAVIDLCEASYLEEFQMKRKQNQIAEGSSRRKLTQYHR